MTISLCIVEYCVVSWCLLDITQPEFIIHIAKASRVILPVAEKLQPATLASEENLQEKDNKRKWIVWDFNDHQTKKSDTGFQNITRYLQRILKLSWIVFDKNASLSKLKWKLRLEHGCKAEDANFTKEMNHNLSHLNKFSVKSFWLILELNLLYFWSHDDKPSQIKSRQIVFVCMYCSKYHETLKQQN